jgi:hypothetical protein
MCIACELGFLDMLEALSPQEREQILHDETARFACDAPEAQLPAADPAKDERKP